MALLVREAWVALGIDGRFLPTPRVPAPSGTPTVPVTATATVTVPLATPTGTIPARSCVGDCNADDTVSVAELITGVNIALGSRAVESCASLDSDENGDVTVNELITAVNNALNDCE